MLKRTKRAFQIFFTALRYICALVCAVGLALSLVATMLLVTADNQLFKSGTYKQALLDTDMYARLPALISQELSAGLSGTPDQQAPGYRYLQSVSITDWEVLIRSVLPPELLQQVSEQTLDRVFDYLDGKSSVAVLSLTPIKQQLDQKSLDVARQILNVQPHCTLAQMADLLLQITSGNPPGNVAFCDPPAEISETFLPLLDPAVKAAIDTIPNGITLLDDSHHPEVLAQAQQIRQEMRLSPLVPLAFLLLMSLLAVRSRTGWLRWWGIPLTIAGGLGLLAGSLYVPILRQVLLQQGAGLTSLFGPASAAAQDLLLAVARSIASPLLIESALLVTAGIVLLVLSPPANSEPPSA